MIMEIYIARDGNETGPYSQDQIESLHRTGMIQLDDFVWHEGMEGWVPLHRFLGVRPPAPLSSSAGKNVDAEGVPALSVAINREGEPAGFFVKAGAYLLDYLIIWICVTIPVAMIWNRVFGGSMGYLYERFTAEELGTSGESISIQWNVIFAFYVVANIIPRWIYTTYMESSSKQATFGKIACGLKVTDESGGRAARQKIGIRFAGIAVTECIPAILCTLLVNPDRPLFLDQPSGSSWGDGAFFIGHLLFGLCVFSERKQCIHDQIAGTLVVRRK